MVIGGRAIAGLGIGAASLTVPVYIAETAPPSIREFSHSIVMVRTKRRERAKISLLVISLLFLNQPKSLQPLF